ncbi:MAG: YtxH domain-containing protein [Actinomycetia bacterium]|nr:YtxH domain-containing protein [Actinomycetes bacterium]
MSNENKCYVPGIIITLAAGLAAGFAAGILLAPKSGKKTRKELIEKGEEFVVRSREGFEIAKVKFAEAVDMGEEFMEKSKETIQKATETVEKKAGKAKEKVGRVIKKGKKAAKKVEDSLS